MKSTKTILPWMVCLCFLPLEAAHAEGSSLSLLNADDGTVMVDSFNYVGDVLNLAELPPRLTIVDSLFGAVAGSVEFFHNGRSVRTENVAPYALGGDAAPGVFAPSTCPSVQIPSAPSTTSLPIGVGRFWGNPASSSTSSPLNRLN